VDFKLLKEKDLKKEENYLGEFTCGDKAWKYVSADSGTGKDLANTGEDLR
jgi:hypothetical protein